jgi:hypothetical protein
MLGSSFGGRLRRQGAAANENPNIERLELAGQRGVCGNGSSGKMRVA